MFKKILIANRGEIAVRISRACAESGVRSAAIYTDADRNALHVKKADESYHIGSDPLSGYLNAHHIVDVAVSAGCDALHPGYGFLSENPELAAVCERKGITFIGPGESLIRRMGDKIEARKSMREAGVPILPGSETNLKDLDEAMTLAEEYGYPVMLKATAGGGGRGIRRCGDKDELARNYDRVKSEVTKAFGSADIFLEKCLDKPRHIEVQILADNYGNVVHLFERDCSIQRRHQKLVEIAPSPQLTEQQRETVCGLAVKAAKAVGYINAGTVEFLLNDEGEFYFMEMNTRLQVEHTISEQITGIDIVREQIHIAAGEELSVKQENISLRGYAIQYRINAEDPKNDFLPNFGRITRYYAPGGPGVRTDAAIYTGYEFPPYFDSMCAKVIVWALDWERAILRSRRVLEDIRLFGLKTTIPYQLEILKTREFQEANFNTGFVEEHPELLNYPVRMRPQSMAAVIAAAIAAHHSL